MAYVPPHRRSPTIESDKGPPSLPPGLFLSPSCGPVLDSPPRFVEVTEVEKEQEVATRLPVDSGSADVKKQDMRLPPPPGFHRNDSPDSVLVSAQPLRRWSPDSIFAPMVARLLDEDLQEQANQQEYLANYFSPAVEEEETTPKAEAEGQFFLPAGIDDDDEDEEEEDRPVIDDALTVLFGRYLPDSSVVQALLGGIFAFATFRSLVAFAGKSAVNVGLVASAFTYWFNWELPQPMLAIWSMTPLFVVSLGGALRRELGDRFEDVAAILVTLAFVGGCIFLGLTLPKHLRRAKKRAARVQLKKTIDDGFDVPTTTNRSRRRHKKQQPHPRKNKVEQPASSKEKERPAAPARQRSSKTRAEFEKELAASLFR